MQKRHVASKRLTDVKYFSAVAAEVLRKVQNNGRCILKFSDLDNQEKDEKQAAFASDVR